MDELNKAWKRGIAIAAYTTSSTHRCWKVGETDYVGLPYGAVSERRVDGIVQAGIDDVWRAHDNGAHCKADKEGQAVGQECAGRNAMRVGVSGSEYAKDS